MDIQVVIFCALVVTLIELAHGGTCPTNCDNHLTCDDPGGGCPRCMKEWWGRLCNYPMECYWKDAPSKYRGTVNTTVSGRSCQRWDRKYPHDHKFGPPLTGDDDANYCRSPENHPQPWCYTTDRNVRWEKCRVPRCDSNNLCPAPELPIISVVDHPSTQGFVLGYTIDVMLSCGDNTSQQALITCQQNRTWSSDGCKDKKSYCPRPALQRNSYIHEDHNLYYRHNDTIVVRCLPGFDLQGQDNFVCQDNGTWNGNMPRCHRNGSELCPAKCEDFISCDNRDQGCPKCKAMSWGRQCEYAVECRTSERGEEYRGTINRTVSGIPCQLWQSQYPHKHSYSARLDIGSENYCRNPDNEPKPWCYTTDKDVRWQVCHIPKCDTVCPPPVLPAFSRVIDPAIKPFYVGYKLYVSMMCDGRNASTVISCQSDLTWSYNLSCSVVHCTKPSLHNNSFIVGGGNNRLYAQNDTIEIRCPEGFTQEGNSVFACQADRAWNGSMPTCNGGVCPDKCVEGVPCNDLDGACPRCKPGWWGRHCQYPLECYKDRGAEYMGMTSITVSGRRCQPWLSLTPHRHRFNFSDALNYCRNPDNEPGPWCYTMDPSKRWELCPVPRCNNPGLCPPPDLPMYSSLPQLPIGGFYTDYVMQVNITCGNDYSLSSISCRADRSWTLDRLKCDVVFCPAPVLLNHSRLIEDEGGPYQQNDTIHVGCEEGYVPRGQIVFACQENTEWNGTMPICEGLRCPQPELSSNSLIIHDGHPSANYSFPNSVTIGCEKGYVLSGNGLIQCQANGTWNSSWPSCQVVECPVPNLSPHSLIVNKQNRYAFGNSIVVTCEEDYELYGHSTFVCKSDGTWDGTMPLCKGVCPLHCQSNMTCDADGHCPQCDPPWWGTHCQYPRGCRLTPGGSEYRGTMNSTISGLSCQAWSSNAPHAHQYGKTVDISAGNSCRNPDGEAGPWCYTEDPKKRWELCPVPLCSSVDTCPTPVLPKGAIVVNPPMIGFFRGYVLMLHIQCEIGEERIGTENKKCLSVGKWATITSACKAVKCSHPVFEKNSYIDYERNASFVYRSTIHVKCRDGYIIEGQEAFTCNQNKEWNGTMPQCKVVNCTQPDLAAFSYITSTMEAYPFGSDVLVKCIKGYQLIGQNVFRCQSDGTWNGLMPKCTAIQCSMPTISDSHLVILGSTDNLKPGNNLTIGCREGLKIVAESSFQCLPNGTWTGRLPTCTEVVCPVPSLNNNSYIENPKNDSYNFKDTIEVLCMEGFSASTMQRLICQQDGTWYGQLPICTPLMCAPPDLPPLKLVIIPHDEDMKVGSVLHVRCIDGMEVFGSASLTCQKNGTWTEDRSKCQVVNCAGPSLGNSSVIVRGRRNSYKYGDTVTLMCAEGYTIQDPVTLACLQNKEWNGTVPKCEALSCKLPVLNDKLDISIKSKADLLFGGTLNLICKEGFRTIGNNKLHCEADGQWRGEQPSCQAMNCKLPPLLPNMSLVVLHGNGITPGDIIAVRCTLGMKLKGPGAMMCLNNGTWNVSLPSCEDITCVPPDAHVTPIRILNPVKDKYLYNDIVRVKCMDGLEINGSDTIKCDLDGTWGSYTYLCKAVSCELPTLQNYHIIKGKTISKAILVDDVISIGCYVDDTVFGFIDLMCNIDKQWNATLPTCDDHTKNPDKAKQSSPIRSDDDGLSPLMIGVLSASVIIFLMGVVVLTFFGIRKIKENVRLKRMKNDIPSVTYNELEHAM